MKYKMLESLLPYLCKFESLHPESDLEDFAHWLQIETNATLHRENLPIPPWETLESSLAKHIVFMYRYAKYYAKAALSDSELQNGDEFSFLVTLMVDKQVSKSALIKANLFEKTSGIEIINRLIKKGYVVEQENIEDKRKKMLALTPSGMAALQTGFEGMQKVCYVVSDVLTEREKIQFFHFLHRLHLFHQPAYERVFNGKSPFNLVE